MGPSAFAMFVEEDIDETCNSARHCLFQAETHRHKEHRWHYFSELENECKGTAILPRWVVDERQRRRERASVPSAS